HPWMYGWVLVLPQSPENAIHTVTLNASSGIPDPCETFRMPCPLHQSNYNFTAQKFGQDIYIEKVTANGVDNYAVIKPNKTCYYPPSYANSCTNPDDLAILRLVGVDTSIPQENVHVAISGLAPSYLVGEPIDFEINIKGFGHCDIPSVLVTHQGYIDWQSKTSWPSDTTPCETGMHDIDKKYDIGYIGGPFSINQTGTYTIHVDYASNSTEVRFDVIPKIFTITNNNTNENNQSQPLTNTGETGTIRLQNMTYDFLVLNATMKGYHNPPLQTMFDGIQFTLLPGPWSGGPPGGCSGTPFRAEAKASDGLYIPLDVFVPDEPCKMNFTTTSLGWHSGLGAGLTINHGNLMIFVSKWQNDSSAEQIRIIPEYPITTGINKNGTITESETIEILFDNFKQNLPLVIQIFNPHGGFYKVDTIIPSEIQSDGFYKYKIYLKGNESDMGKYNVVITHGNATASTSAYLSNAVP
ncbi:MAG: hypothetical protein KGL95_05695, partial [Patescibacteria group bacterium]|nr:hypothetical protein [Patescibacteria group bacterium]